MQSEFIVPSSVQLTRTHNLMVFPFNTNRFQTNRNTTHNKTFSLRTHKHQKPHTIKSMQVCKYATWAYAPRIMSTQCTCNFHISSANLYLVHYRLCSNGYKKWDLGKQKQTHLSHICIANRNETEVQAWREKHKNAKLTAVPVCCVDFIRGAHWKHA